MGARPPALRRPAVGVARGAGPARSRSGRGAGAPRGLEAAADPAVPRGGGGQRGGSARHLHQDRGGDVRRGGRVHRARPAPRLPAARGPAPARRPRRRRDRGDRGRRPPQRPPARHPRPPQPGDVPAGSGTLRRPPPSPRGHRPGGRAPARGRRARAGARAEPVLRGRGPPRPEGGARRRLAAGQGAAPRAGGARTDGGRPARRPRGVRRAERPRHRARRAVDRGDVDARLPALDPGRRLAPRAVRAEGALRLLPPSPTSVRRGRPSAGKSICAT